MCGICGLISQEKISPSRVDQIRVANQHMYHRGPDGAGEFIDTYVALAMRRLSIIDLTGGWQPIYNEDRSLALIANGEIYNFVELRSQLQARGHVFSTGSDCETILHLYEEYGTDCVLHLRGMFAFALWDGNRQRLMLARDRMGEKPLYIYEQDNQLIFASEMKALLRSGMVPFELDAVAVNRYFHYQYVPEPATAIKGVRKLAAAHHLIVDTIPWRIRESCYWSITEAQPTEGDPGELIRAELDEVSRLVVRSDVPVGVALSGGLDSSAVAALVVQKYPGTIHAFSVGYPGRPPNDERAEAATLADHLDMPFHDIEVSIDEMVAFFPELVYWRDDPIADISGYGYYTVMRLARERGVPVILQGQGGDELFWGYPWVKQAVDQSLQKMDLLNKRRRSLIGYVDLHLPDSYSRRCLWGWLNSWAGLRTGWRRLRRDKTTPPERMVFYDLLPDFQVASDGVQDIYTAGFMEQLHQSDATGLFSFPLPWPQVDILLTSLICQTYLLGNGIIQGDRLSMASSVEQRLPLVDHRLVETVVGLRRFRADHQEPPKAWFKTALKDILPDWVLNRPKRGFAPPVRVWHRALFAAHGSMLQGGYLVQSGVLRSESARDLSCGPFPNGVVTPLSFKALVLEAWCRGIISH